MNMQLDRQITEQQLRTDIPKFKSGNTVSVAVEINEGNKKRTQVFTGLVLKRQGSGISSSFTVRKLTGSISVERTFPLHSPLISKIEVLKIGRVRRARLYYMRDRIGKAAKIKEVVSFNKKKNKAEY
ncbi:50S ribosomal protein L19 [Spiroplasma endosymbiont of Asaphidion curtum]|uniref:50S ribosomal protein L19 n=1 Tax=Spiroplasma endosymbiont of Asaphidion curtum TaxID=3066281 RepID=UPI00313B6396